MTALALLEQVNAGCWRARYLRHVGTGAVEHGRHVGSWSDVRAVMLDTLEDANGERRGRLVAPARQPC